MKGLYIQGRAQLFTALFRQVKKAIKNRVPLKTFQVL